jgi:hypothetical protein
VQTLGLNLTKNSPEPFQPARASTKERNPLIMRTLDTIMNVLSFLLLAIVLYALAPLLIKLIAVANGVHHLLGV